jgi:formylglycine-generating enzyme required for sulfatase activity
MASGAACTEGGGHFCDGSGACVECVSATTCPGQDTDCQSRTCAGNTCGVSFMQAGTPASIQVTGDCKRKQCDGNGGITDAVYDADVPVDFNQCSGDVCTAGQPSNPSLPSGTTCNQNGGQVCNGAGACVECIDSSMCVDQTCVSGACTGVCAPGQVRCKGDVPQSCDSNGNWADGVLCQAYCSQGACINPPSCEGIGAACGPNASTHCCSAMQVPGGSFSRSYDGVTYTDPQYLATVSPFLLDRYEITVGRFHNFVKAYPNNLPSAGDGKNPNNNQQDPGWNDSWNGQLPADQSALKTSLACPGGTWTDSPGGNETKPINCVSWYLAFAFCIWDGGRLPTEAEWNYAAAGGGGAEGQRVYPWSNPPGSTVIDATYAVYQPASIGTVGSKSTKGDARYSQADMAGNVSEWVLDWYAYPYPSTSCNDCANFAATSDRAIRGGNYLSVPDIVKVSVRTSAPPGYTGSSLGWRCARN